MRTAWWLFALLAVLFATVLADTFYDDLGVGPEADEATIKKVCFP
jgi:hypothetical protein